MPKAVREDGFIEYTGLWWKFALPQVLLAVHLGVVGLLCAWSAARFGAWTWNIALGVGIGYLVWTFFEYVLHRWLLHHTRRPLLRKIFWKALHAEHHGYRRMRDPDHHGVHVLIVLPIVGVAAGGVALFTATGWGPAVLAGWFLGYCAYEALHWLFHAGDPQRGFGRLPFIRHLWLAHTVHHLYRIRTNYGFVSLFWDRCFGTYVAPRDIPGFRHR